MVSADCICVRSHKISLQLNKGRLPNFKISCTTQGIFMPHGTEVFRLKKSHTFSYFQCSNVRPDSFWDTPNNHARFLQDINIYCLIRLALRRTVVRKCRENTHPFQHCNCQKLKGARIKSLYFFIMLKFPVRIIQIVSWLINNRKSRWQLGNPI